MQPSNPATFFVSGSDQEEFKYEPGKDPYYVIARSKSYIPLSVLVFADSTDHAKKIIEAMIAFMEASLAKYAQSKGAEYDKHDFQGRRSKLTETFKKALTPQ